MVDMLSDHLWQSTLFAAAIALLMFTVLGNRAAVRHGLWLVASVKFLIPFGALVAIGSQIEPRAVPISPGVWVDTIDTVAQPFSSFASDARAGLTTSRDAVGRSTMTTVAAGIWLAGLAAMFAIWCTRWRHVAAAARFATPLSVGRVVTALRRIESAAGVIRPLPVVSCVESHEPGVFGIRRPMLLWPKGFEAHLDEAQIEAIMAHEVAHVRRRDNLAAAVHMLVRAIFWFHPLVWWIGARLVDERERACDEEVIRLGSRPEVYAESILKTCQFTVESPLACVAGVTGSDLTKRIEQIMRNDSARRLNLWKKLLLSAGALGALAGPLALGAMGSPALSAQARSTSPPPQFDVASIKPSLPGTTLEHGGVGIVWYYPGGRLMAKNAALIDMVAFAYDVHHWQISGGPSWINPSMMVTVDRFNVEARADGDVGRDRARLMLRTLLADRFQLSLHSETTTGQTYELVVERKRPELNEIKVDKYEGSRLRGGGGRMLVDQMTMPEMADYLKGQLRTPVADKTGLAGIFKFNLVWTPDSFRLRGVGAPGGNGEPGIDPDGPSLFDALREQLGLRLRPTEGPIERLIIDRAERPTEN